MRKFLKDSILEILKTMYEAHKILQKSVGKKEYENAQGLLADCQNILTVLVSIGDVVHGFLDDKQTYLGSQLESEFGGRCFGIAANMDFLLVCTYEKNGENPALVVYKKR